MSTISLSRPGCYHNPRIVWVVKWESHVTAMWEKVKSQTTRPVGHACVHVVRCCGEVLWNVGAASGSYWMWLGVWGSECCVMKHGWVRCGKNFVLSIFCIQAGKASNNLPVALFWGMFISSLVPVLSFAFSSLSHINIKANSFSFPLNVAWLILCYSNQSNSRTKCSLVPKFLWRSMETLYKEELIVQLHRNKIGMFLFYSLKVPKNKKKKWSFAVMWAGDGKARNVCFAMWAETERTPWRCKGWVKYDLLGFG